MTQPLTQQQIADAKQTATKIITSKSVSVNGAWSSDFVLSLIATIEARDVAFEEMMAALKALLETIKETQEAGYIKETEENESVIAAHSAIAHAEKVK